eukprot:scaffold223806_cov33-Tisochrysis_lutea.AAC.1
MEVSGVWSVMGVAVEVESGMVCVLQHGAWLSTWTWGVLSRCSRCCEGVARWLRGSCVHMPGRVGQRCLISTVHKLTTS